MKKYLVLLLMFLLMSCAHAPIKKMTPAERFFYDMKRVSEQRKKQERLMGYWSKSDLPWEVIYYMHILGRMR